MDYLPAMHETERNNLKKNLRIIVFTVKGTEYALIVDNIFEIIVRNTLTPVPQTSRFIKGAIAYKDKIIPVFDTAGILGHPETISETAKHTVIVVNYQGRFLGLEADSVTDIVESDSVTLHAVVVKEMGSAIEGIGVSGNRFFFLLNTEKIITTKEPFDIKIQDVILKKMEERA